MGSLPSTNKSIMGIVHFQHATKNLRVAHYFNQKYFMAVVITPQFSSSRRVKFKVESNLHPISMVQTFILDFGPYFHV